MNSVDMSLIPIKQFTSSSHGKSIFQHVTFRAMASSKLKKMRITKLKDADSMIVDDMSFVKTLFL